jgi:hypothetical protein
VTIKFFGGERANIDYLIRNPTATVLKGSAEVTSKIIDSLDFKQRFCSGCLSFNETLSDAKMEEHIAEFEAVIGAGLAKESLNGFWLRHRDKKRDEAHFIFPQTDLVTGTQLTIYLDWRDRDLVNNFRDCVNLREGYSRPNDPTKKRMTSVPIRASKTTQEFIHQIDDLIKQQVEVGSVGSREDVVAFLEIQGLEIKRGRKGQLPKEYLKIKRKGDDKFIGLRGAYYRSDFVSRDTLKADLPSIPTEEVLKIAEEKMQKEIEQRAYRQGKRHETALRAAERRKARVLAPIAHSTASEIILDLDTKPRQLARPSDISAEPEIQHYEAERTANPVSEINNGVGDVASQRGGIVGRAIDGIRHIFEELFCGEHSASSGTEDVSRIGLALDGCGDLLQRATEHLSRAVGRLAAAIGQRELNQRVPSYLKEREIPVTPNLSEISRP